MMPAARFAIFEFRRFADFTLPTQRARFRVVTSHIRLGLARGKLGHGNVDAILVNNQSASKAVTAAGSPLAGGGV